MKSATLIWVLLSRSSWQRPFFTAQESPSRPYLWVTQKLRSTSPPTKARSQLRFCRLLMPGSATALLSTWWLATSLTVSAFSSVRSFETTNQSSRKGISSLVQG
ncbi:Hypothetical_protein [Hexamita inflata]|uniref:Hypothetical_protein n=1 Tax=Hexamita inflata TaxID=28002 RepID=A0ABP1KRA1_9EUKA